MNIENGNQYTTPIYGGEGGKSFGWSIPFGQEISAIYVRSGPRVFSIQFELTNGKKSDVFGGDGSKFKKQGDYYNSICCEKKRIAGVKVRSGS